MVEQRIPRVLNLKSINYKVPEGAIYIGRAIPRYHLQESKWHNPFHIGAMSVIHVGEKLNREQSILLYEEYLERNPELLISIKELKGKDLICWCAPLPCHGDILLKLANPTCSISTLQSADNDGLKTNTLAAKFMDEYWKRCER